MINYDYILEDGGDGSAFLRVFFNKNAFDLYVEKMEEINQEHYILDTGVIRVYGNIYEKDLFTIDDVKRIFS